MSHTLVRPEAGAVVEVHDLRGAVAHPTAPPVLHDPTGRRAVRIRTGARAVLGLLLAWLAGLLLAGLGLLPAGIIPFGFLVSAPAPPALVAMSGADHAADGRPGTTSAVGIVLGTATAISANDFKPLKARELRALGVSRPSSRSQAPADPRGSASPAPGLHGVAARPIDAPRVGGHDAAGAVAPAADRPHAPSSTEPSTSDRPSKTASPAASVGGHDPSAGNGGGSPNAGGGNANPNAGGGNANANAGGNNGNAGGGNSNAGGGNSNAGANAGGAGANAGVGGGNAGADHANGGNGNAGGNASPGGNGTAGTNGSAGSNAGGNADANAHGNAGGNAGGADGGAGQGQSGNASNGDANGGNGSGKPRGRSAAS